jgi:hypothetical protein
MGGASVKQRESGSVAIAQLEQIVAKKKAGGP